jgi:beta-glucosidase
LNAETIIGMQEAGVIANIKVKPVHLMPRSLVRDTNPSGS